MASFLRDSEAVTEPLGILLMLVIFLGAWSLYQTILIPSINAAEDNDLFSALEDDFTSLKTTIEDVAVLDVAKSTAMNLGVEYSNKLFFINPSMGVIGTLEFEPHTVTVNYTRYGTSYSESFTTFRAIYSSSDLRQYPDLVWEAGSVIYAFPEYNRSFQSQTTILNDELSIPLLNTSLSPQSAVGEENFQFFPPTRTTTLSNIDDVVVSIDTKYPDAWESLLSNSNSSQITVTFQDGKVVINASKPDQMIKPVFSGSDPNAVYADILQLVKYTDTTWATGQGQSTTGSGSQWSNIPNSSEITLMSLQDFITDDSSWGGIAPDLNNDYYMVSVVDLDDGDWWKLLMEFDKTPDEISNIQQKSKSSGVSTYQVSGSDISAVNSIELTSSLVIQLLEESDYDITNGLYQNAGIGDNNQLTVLMGDKSTMTETAIVSITLTVE